MTMEATMVYAYAQRVAWNDPDAVFAAAEGLAPTWGLEPGPRVTTHGALRERMLPLSRRGLRGRLWVWSVHPGLAAVYLGLDHRGAAAWIPLLRGWVRARRMRQAAVWLGQLQQAVGAEPPARSDPIHAAA